MTLGQAIKLGRTKKGIKQKEVAAYFDIDDSSVWRWENDKAIPKDVNKVLEYLDVDFYFPE